MMDDRDAFLRNLELEIERLKERQVANRHLLIFVVVMTIGNTIPRLFGL